MKDTQMSLFGTPKASKKVTSKEVTKRRRHNSRNSKRHTKRSSKKHTAKRVIKHKAKKVIKPKAKKQRTTNTAKTNNKPQVQSNKKNPPVLSATDKAYQQLVNAKLATKCHIFEGGKTCESIALSYCNPDQLHVPLGESMNIVCSRSRQTKPHCYYHYINHHFIMYDSWLMDQIYKYRDDIK